MDGRTRQAHTAHKRRNELDEHQAIFDAVMGHRLEDAQQLMAEHYQRTAELFDSAV